MWDGGADGSGSVEVQHQRVRFAVLSEVPDSRDRLSEVGFLFLSPLPRNLLPSPHFLNWRTELPQEAAFDCRYVVGKKGYSCQFEGLWAVLLQHKQIIIIDKNGDTAPRVSAGVSCSAAPRGVCYLVFT